MHFLLWAYLASTQTAFCIFEIHFCRVYIKLLRNNVNIVSADPKRKKMTPKDYARASIKFYADMRNKRLMEGKMRLPPGMLMRGDSEFNTSALISYNKEESCRCVLFVLIVNN